MTSDLSKHPGVPLRSADFLVWCGVIFGRTEITVTSPINLY